MQANELSNLKQQIISSLISQLEEKKKTHFSHQKDLQDALQSEQKSTAGDKHDTNRAMIHLEQEKLQHQYQLLQHQIQNLVNIKGMQVSTNSVEFGSLVKTSNSIFFIGVGLGKQFFEGITIYCIGVDSPIGQTLIHKKKGDEFIFNGQKEEVLQIG